MQRYLFLFLLLPSLVASVQVKAQNSFAKNDFTTLCTSLIVQSNYHVDSILYEHNFKLIKKEDSPKILKYYSHNYIEDVTLALFFTEDVQLLHVLIFTGDYNYYKGLRKVLSDNLEVTDSNIDLYGYNCKVMETGIGKNIDGINAEDNSFMIGWIGKIEGWGEAYNRK